MSSNMAGNAKQINVLTSYKLQELKQVKVAIRRHNIKLPGNTGQPLERSFDDPYSITYMVHMSGGEYGKLFRRITPNTIELPADAYSKRKSEPGETIEPSKYEPEPGASRQRSASCSSEEECKDTRRSRSSEKCKATEVAPAAKIKRRSAERERAPSGARNHEGDESPGHFEKRKATRSRSRSPTNKHSQSRRHSRSTSPHYSRSRSIEKYKTTDAAGTVVKSKRRSPDHERIPSSTRPHEHEPTRSSSRSPSNRHSSRSRRHSRSNSPHYRYRSRSPRRSKTPTGKERVRNLSNKPGEFRPDKSGHSHTRDRHSYSKSPSPDRRHSLGRRHSRDDSRERYRSGSHERRPDDSRPEYVDPEYYPRNYYDPAMIRPHPPMVPPIQFYPTVSPFYAGPVIPRQFMPRPFFNAGVVYRPNKPLPVYNNRPVERFVAADSTGANAVAKITNKKPSTGWSKTPPAVQVKSNLQVKTENQTAATNGSTRILNTQ